MKRLPLVGAIACARSSNTNNQSQRINKFELVGRLMKRPRTLAIACGLVVTLTALAAYAQTCAPEPPGSGLIAWWPLNETSGTAVADVLGQHPGTASSPIGTGTNSNPRSETGLVGSGLNFHFGSRVSVNDIGNDLDFGTSNSFTIDAWIKGSSGPIVGNYNINPPRFGYFLYVASSSATLNFEMGNGSAVPPTWSSVATINPAVWTFVAVVVDRANQTVTMYTGVPPNLVSSGPLTNPSLSGANASGGLPLLIGGCSGNPNGCNSVIDEVEIFNRALAPADLQNIFNAGSAGKCVAKGMTWKVGAVNPTDGTITVGCGSSQPGACNPYIGDRPCTDSLPLLCFKPFTPILPVPTSVNDTNYYYRWSGGIVGTTAPVQASSFNGLLANANTRCVQEFGANWRVAEFHDGANGAGGWNFQAYGNVGNPSSRFWVHINDQPNGTCWPH